jgi:hypothetical protein
MSKQKKAKTITSHISNAELYLDDAYQGRQIRQGVLQLIRKDHPTFTDESYISTGELAEYRKLYLHRLVSKESGDLDKLESDVLKSITNNKILSENIEETIDEQFTFGQRIADKIATFGGSWTFILTFFFYCCAGLVLM